MEPTRTPKKGELQVVKPEMALEKFASQKKDILSLVSKEMKPDKDFGIIPGTTKRTLYLAGAEKLAKFFGLVPTYVLTKEIENFDQANPTFAYYRYKCTLTHLATGIVVGDSERSCNSNETKYRNKTIFDLANTCKAMAQKRALVAAVRTATMASDIFDSDLDENGKLGPTTKIANPVRTGLINKLWAVAKPRGFTDELVHRIILKKYELESVTELSGEQINKIVETLLANYSIVPEGQKPSRIVTEGQGQPVKLVEETAEVQEEGAEDDDIPEDDGENLCRCGCGNEIMPNSFSPYFFSQECSNRYWKPTKEED